MINLWEIDCAGVRKFASEWGVVNISTRKENLKPHTAELSVGGTDFDSADVFASNSVIKLYRGGVQCFYGEVIASPVHGSGKSEGQSYTVANPWQWLEETIYRQQWALSGGGIPTSHTFLNVAINASAQIRHILNWAIQRGAPLQIGTISADVLLPVRELRGAMCAEAIRQELKCLPDAVVEWDYATTPPTIHLRRKSDLAAVAISLDSGQIEGDVNLTPRYDLVVPSVLLNFERSVDINGQPRLQVSQQLAGPPHPTLPPPATSATGLERRCLEATINLQGAKVSTVNMSLLCEPINAATGNQSEMLAWWKKAHAWLGDGSVSGVVIDDITVVGDDGEDVLLADYPRQLIQGELPEWLLTGNNFRAKRVVITAKVDFTLTVAGGIDQVGTQQLSVAVCATDATSGDYSALASVETGETEPAGLASYLYASHSVLHWDGRVTLGYDDVPATEWIGKTLNLPGGTGKYATIAALIQGVEEDLASGKVTLTLGTPRHLGAADIVEWLGAFRNRIVWTNPATQQSGDSGGSGSVDMGGYSPVSNSSIGPVAPNFQAVRHPTSPSTRHVTIDSRADPVVSIAGAGGSASVIGGQMQVVSPGGTTTVLGGQVSTPTVLTSSWISAGDRIILDPAVVPEGKQMRPMIWNVCVGSQYKQALVLACWLT